ncbi:ATP-NAD kinase-like domain-containing protein [Mrakia frigida]|uniref:ATP-NAD kinase-like domain-containing protein n=1 Tax=Mrakia frigida TaxID=29902 RepID=UPI003FCC0C87
MSLLQPTPPLPPSTSLSSSPLPSSSSSTSAHPSSLNPVLPVDNNELFVTVQQTGISVKLSLVGDELVMHKVLGGGIKGRKEGSSSSEGFKLAPKPLLTIPTLLLISSSLSTSSNPPSPSNLLLRINYLSSKSKGHTLTQLRLLLPSASNPQPFLARLDEAAYPHRRVEATKRVLLVVNPFGGKAGAVKVADKVVKPILEAAALRKKGRAVTVEVVQTTHGGHARDVAETLDPDAFDVIGVVSGDGVIHELFNGFAGRKDALKCLRIPIVPIPAGSGNGLSISIHGKVDGWSCSLATLNLIKGTPLTMDLCSIKQGSRPRLISFLSTTVGLTAEVDLGTDHLRWMGDTRFTYGVIKKTMELSTWQGTVYLKLDPSTNPPSKAVFARHLQRSVDSSSRLSGSTSPSPPTSRPELEGDGPLPDLPEDEGATPWLDEETRDQWVRFESGGKKGAGANGSGKKEDLLYVYTGTVGMMSRDFLAFPFIAPGEGYMDVVVQEMTSRTIILKNFIGAESGAPVLDSSMKYFRASALHFIPSTHPQHISIDGEALASEHGPFTVEVFAQGRTMGLRGRWEGGDEFVKEGYLERALKLEETY